MTFISSPFPYHLTESNTPSSRSHNSGTIKYLFLLKFMFFLKESKMIKKTNTQATPKINKESMGVYNIEKSRILWHIKIQ